MFYIWRRIINNEKIRFVIIPFYSFSIYYTSRSLLESRGVLWFIIYLLALILSLLLVHLTEPRYFTPGALIAVLNSDISKCHKNALYFAIMIFILVNITTIVIFRFFPFTSNDGSSLERFLY